MSKEERVEPLIAAGLPPSDGEDDKLQIDLRLKLDEVAEFEAVALREKARRSPTRRELCRLACQMFDARRTRDRMFDRELFGEPAWDLLLALYCLPVRGELLTVTSLSYAADVPQATGHRWQRILQSEGLIERGPEGVDLRKQTIRLTDKGRTLMDAYLKRLFYCDTPLPPDSEVVDS